MSNLNQQNFLFFFLGSRKVAMRKKKKKRTYLWTVPFVLFSNLQLSVLNHTKSSDRWVCVNVRSGPTPCCVGSVSPFSCGTWDQRVFPDVPQIQPPLSQL